MSGASTSDDPDAPGPTPDTRPAGRLAVLEPALWQRLNDATSLQDLATAWLVLQCRMIPGADRGLVRVLKAGKLETLCTWPESGSNLTDLNKAAELAIADRRAIAKGGAERNAPASIALPVIVDDEIAAVVALGIAGAGRDEMRDAIRQLQWGAAWLRDQLRREQGLAEGTQLDRSRTTIDLIATILEHERFSMAVTAAATDLAMRFDCSRVSIGFSRNNTSRIAAISHTAQFGRRMNLVRLIGSAMDEAIDQRCLILYPAPPEEAVATMAHADLAREDQDGAVLTVPMFVVDRFIGAITFERAHDQRFDADAVKLADVVATAIGPILDEKRRNDRWIVVKAWESLTNQVKRLLGPGYIGRKLAVAAGLILVAFFSFASDTYRVSGDAQLDGAERRSVVSPYDGYLRDAPIRAGAVVKAGDVLADLDDRDLVLERLRWDTERQQHQLEYDQALAARQPATVNVSRSKIAQAEAQMKLIDEQIARTRFTAPFDGIVVSGDLSQRVGGSVSRGEVLYEIAPLTGYRVVLWVDERVVADAAPGQDGEVVFSALPDRPFRFTVDKIVPVAMVKDGRNMFRVEAHLDENSESLRPGMIGVGKIDIGQRKLIDIWTKPIFDWARLSLWRIVG